MAVQRMKHRPAFRGMFEHYGRTVVIRIIVIRHTVHHSVQRRKNRTPRRLEQIHAQMHRAQLRPCSELLAPVYEAHFSVPPNADPRPFLTHPARDMPG